MRGRVIFQRLVLASGTVFLAACSGSSAPDPSTTIGGTTTTAAAATTSLAAAASGEGAGETSNRGLMVWFLGLLGAAIAAVLLERTTKWISSLYDRIVALVDRRLFRIAFFRERRLATYRRAVAEDLALLKVPFRSTRLRLADVYVPLAVYEQTDDDPRDAVEIVRNARRVAIVGAPGSGKSVLLKHLALQWCEQRLPADLFGSTAVHLPLHLVEEEATLLATIQSRIAHYAGKRTSERLWDTIQRQGCILLLDGLDEVRADRRPQLVREAVALLGANPAHRIVLTCRSAVYHDELQQYADGTFRILPFQDSQIEQFVHSWGEMQPGRSPEALCVAIRERPRLVDLAGNPLLLTLMTELYSTNSDDKYALPHSRAAFYAEAADMLVRGWTEQRTGRIGVGEGTLVDIAVILVILRALALEMQRGASGRRDVRRIPTVRAAEIVQSICDGVKLDLNSYELLAEIRERIGVIEAVDGGEFHSFTHLTLQEYFAASALAGDAASLLSDFMTSPTEWREVAILWCGLAPDCTQVVMALAPDHLELAFEAMVDAKYVEPNLAREVLKAVRTPFERRFSPELSRIFASVASSPTPLGRDVLQYLLDLSETADDNQLKHVLPTLASSNTPEAANRLIEMRRAGHPLARAGLTSMGDLAVRHLGGIGTIDAAEDLAAIGTARAAVALADMVLAGPSGVAEPGADVVAAWGLAQLMPQPGVTHALARSIEARAVPEADPLFWRPFFSAQTSLELIVLYEAICSTLNRHLISGLPELHRATILDRGSEPSDFDRIVVASCLRPKDNQLPLAKSPLLTAAEPLLVPSVVDQLRLVQLDEFTLDERRWKDAQVVAIEFSLAQSVHYKLMLLVGCALTGFAATFAVNRCVNGTELVERVLLGLAALALGVGLVWQVVSRMPLETADNLVAFLRSGGLLMERRTWRDASMKKWRWLVYAESAGRPPVTSGRRIVRVIVRLICQVWFWMTMYASLAFSSTLLLVVAWWCAVDGRPAITVCLGAVSAICLLGARAAKRLEQQANPLRRLILVLAGRPVPDRSADVQTRRAGRHYVLGGGADPRPPGSAPSDERLASVVSRRTSPAPPAPAPPAVGTQGALPAKSSVGDGRRLRRR